MHIEVQISHYMISIKFFQDIQESSPYKVAEHLNNSIGLLFISFYDSQKPDTIRGYSDVDILRDISSTLNSVWM